MNDNINMNSTIAGSMNANIHMESTIAGSMNDIINMDRTIAGLMNYNIGSLPVLGEIHAPFLLHPLL
jgi:hypothetical protein